MPVSALSRNMNPRILSLMAAFSLVFNGAALAAGAKTYKVTGTVVAATGSMVTVQKGTERLEIDIDPATTKGSTDLKVGSTVTVTYVMSATRIDAAAAASPASTP